MALASRQVMNARASKAMPMTSVGLCRPLADDVVTDGPPIGQGKRGRKGPRSGYSTNPIEFRMAPTRSVSDARKVANSSDGA